MEFSVLRYFLTIAREGSFTKAANFLHITQPTLSRQIKELEEELGQKLLLRGNHSVSLTTEGIMLRKRAEEIEALVGKTKAEFCSGRQNISGEIYIGGGETQGMRLIAKVIKELRRDYPDIKYHLYSGNAEDVTERLDKGLLDFGILIQPTDLSKYDFIELPVRDRWGIVMPRDCEQAKQKEIQRQDLNNMPLICSRQIMQRALSSANFSEWFGQGFEKLNIVATYNLIFNAALLVEQGVGYALTLDQLVNTTDNSRVCFRPLYPALESALDIVWKKHQVFSPAAKTFMEQLRENL